MILAPAIMTAEKDPKVAAAKCLESVQLDPESYRIGHTKASSLSHPQCFFFHFCLARLFFCPQLFLFFLSRYQHDFFALLVLPFSNGLHLNLNLPDTRSCALRRSTRNQTRKSVQKLFCSLLVSTRSFTVWDTPRHVMNASFYHRACVSVI